MEAQRDTGNKKSFSITSPVDPTWDEHHRQDGIKEYLLCEACEGQFSRYEDYAARTLFHIKGPLHQRPDEHYICDGLNYKQMKLFQTSILWRMRLSSHAFYHTVKLGKHEEILRRMLRAEDPGEPWR